MMTLSLFLIKGLLVLAVAFVSWFALRGQSAVLRDRIWTLAFCALLLLMLAPLVLPGWSLPVPEIQQSASTSTASSRPYTADSSAPPTAGVVVLAHERVENRLSVARGIDREFLARVFVLTWGLGTFYFLLRIITEMLSLRRLRRGATTPPLRLQSIADNCVGKLTIGGRPGTLLSEDVAVPMVLGIGSKPVVLLPHAASDWDDHRLRSVLMHELAHVRRRDPAIALLCAVACALHWINPLAWWAARRASTDREEACDMMVLSSGADRFHYAQDLLDTARVISASTFNASSITPHMASATSLRQRIEALLNNRPPVARLGRRASHVSVVVALSALLPIACAKVAETDSAGGMTTRSAVVASLLDTTTSLDERLHAAWRLGNNEDKSAAGALIATLADSDPAMRGMSAWALGEIKEVTALEALINAMEDEDPVAREMVIRAIGEIDDPRAVDPLIAAAASTDESHRAAAVRALGDLSWSNEARASVDIALHDPSPLVRKSAVIALGETEVDERMTAALIPLLQDEAAEVRALTAHTLGSIGDSRAIDALIAASRDANPEVRTWTVWALDEIDDEDRR